MRKLKIIGVPWHVSHQHYLAQLPFVDEYHMIRNPYRGGWGTTHRPQPDNVKFVEHYEKGKYDLAILHIDQQSIWRPETGFKWARLGKARLFHEFKKLLEDDPIPKVVINHMTPFHDHIESHEMVSYMKEAVGDIPMICNSKTAAKQWGWGHVIIHGMKQEDWWDLPKEPRAVTVLSPGGMEKAYRRIFLENVRRILAEKKITFKWVGIDLRFESFDEYRDFLGRSLVFFMPTWQSPMPRARTEAMFSGCCVVTTPYQDADEYFEDGINGFLTTKKQIQDPRIMDNPNHAADIIEHLINNPEKAIAIGQKGKQTAIERFSFDRWADDWKNLLNNLYNMNL